MTLLAVPGVAAGVLSLVDPVPYVRDIVRGLTRPHRGTWLIWSALGATAFASQLADGASWSLAMVGVQTASMTLILVLSLRFGTGGVGIVDLCLIGVAGLGIVGWALSEEPLVATSFVVAADAAGVALMLPKTWRDPWSETLSTYLLAGGSGLLSAVAVGALDASLLLYPGYFAVANGGVAAVIARRRSAISAQLSGEVRAERRGAWPVRRIKSWRRTALTSRFAPLGRQTHTTSPRSGTSDGRTATTGSFRRSLSRLGPRPPSRLERPSASRYDRGDR